MKKLYLVTLMAAAAMGLSAHASTITYSYANDNVAAYGLSAKQVYDVAMLLNNPAMEGAKVTKINAYITDWENFSNCSVWLSSELTLEKGVNVPNIASYSVTPVKSEYAGYDVGLLTATLDEPYIYTGGDLYIGYSLTVTSINTDYEKSPLLISVDTNTDGFFLHGSVTPLKWYEYSSRTGGVAVISVELEGDFPESSLSINSIQDVTAQIGKDFNIKMQVVNAGGESVKTIGYKCDVNAKHYEGTYTLPEPLINNPAAISSLIVPMSGIDSMGYYDASFTITEVNGIPNESSANTFSFKVGIIGAEIVNRPLVEEYTGLWCGYCPRGFTGMEMLGEMYGDDVVIICYHHRSGQAGDNMSVSDNVPTYITGFPGASINRTGTVDPYYGNTVQEFGISKDVAEAMDQQTYCSIRLSDIYVDGDMLTVKTNTVFAKDIPMSKYKIGFVLTANNMFNENWSQINYYSGDKSIIGTPLEFWSTADYNCYGLIFNDVAVNVEGKNGVANSLPSSIKFGEEYTFEYSLKCAGIKNIYNEELPFDLNDAVINFYVLDNNGVVVNANKFHLSEMAGITSPSIENANTTLVETVYYDLSGRKIANPSNGIFVKADKMSDGSIKTSKVVVK